MVPASLRGEVRSGGFPIAVPVLSSTRSLIMGPPEASRGGVSAPAAHTCSCGFPIRSSLLGRITAPAPITTLSLIVRRPQTSSCALYLACSEKIFQHRAITLIVRAAPDMSIGNQSDHFLLQGNRSNQLLQSNKFLFNSFYLLRTACNEDNAKLVTYPE